jgi:RES domain-containing protein
VRIQPDWRAGLDRLAADATSLEGFYFRSVDRRFAHPDDVLSGEGPRRNGGRFASVGSRAIYASDTEETALAEVSARKRRLGGRAQIDLKDYPRVTFVLRIVLARHVRLPRPEEDQQLARLMRACLDEDLGPSQAVGDYLRDRGVQGIVFPSAVCPGVNLVVFKDAVPAAAVEVENRGEWVRTITAMARRLAE